MAPPADGCKRTFWHRAPPSPIIDANGQVTQLAALEQLRQRFRAQHYSYRTEESYTDWARRFLEYLADRQGLPRPCVNPLPCATTLPISPSGV